MIRGAAKQRSDPQIIREYSADDRIDMPIVSQLEDRLWAECSLTMEGFHVRQSCGYREEI